MAKTLRTARTFVAALAGIGMCAAGWGAKVEILPEGAGAAEAEVCRQGEYEVAWQPVGWSVGVAGRPVLLREDFRVWEEGRVEPILDKSEPRRMQASAQGGTIASRLEFNTKLALVGEMRREVVVGANGVSMWWTWSPFSTKGGRGEVTLELPWGDASGGEVELADAEGERTAVGRAGGEVPETLRDGVSSQELLLDHGEFVSRWQWKGDTDKMTVRQLGENGAEMVLAFTYGAGQQVRLQVKVGYERPVEVEGSGWKLALRGRRLHVGREDVQVVAGDFARITGGRKGDLVALPARREIQKTQGEKGASLEIQTASKDAGWLRRRVSAGGLGLSIRYDGALLAKGAKCEVGFVIGKGAAEGNWELLKMDGTVERLAGLPQEEWESPPLASASVRLGGKRIDFIFAREGTSAFQWGLARAGAGRTELRTHFDNERGLSGQVFVRMSAED